MASTALRHCGIVGTICSLVIGLSGCTTGGLSEAVGYAIDGPVVDYNAATVAGHTGGSLAAFPRVNIGFSYLDGLGNRLADTEFGTVQVKLGAPVRVEMHINDRAEFSDGEPITCDDVLFSWLARHPQQGSPFNAMSMPGLSEIGTINCSPQSKHAEIVFQSGQLPRDWLALFGAGTIMPWHIVSRATGVKDLRELLAGSNPEGLARVAEFWNKGWRFDRPSLDLSRFVSSGPYKITGIDEEGAITLERNDKWWGQPARIGRVVIYSTGTNVKQHITDGDVQVGDIAYDDNNPAAPEGATSAAVSSENIMQLRLSTRGLFADPQVRRTFLACVPRTHIQEFVTKDKQSAAGTPEVLGRPAVLILPLGNDPVARQVSEWTHLDTQGTLRKLPRKQRVNIVYPAASSRAKHVIEMMGDACKSRGFTVVGTPTETYTGEILASGNVQAGLFGTAGAVGPGGSFDVASGLVGLSPYRLPDFRKGDARELFVRVTRLNNTQGEDMPIQKDGIDRNTVYAQTVTNLQQYLLDMGYALPLYVQPRWQFVSPGLQGVTQGRSAASVGWNMDRWNS